MTGLWLSPSKSGEVFQGIFKLATISLFSKSELSVSSCLPIAIGINPPFVPYDNLVRWVPLAIAGLEG